MHVARSRVRLAFNRYREERSHGQALAQSGLAVLGSRSCRCCRYPCRERGGDEASAVPAKLAGRWTRTVAAADWKRAGATGFVTSFVGPNTMAVKANGKVSIIDFTATFSPLSGGRLSIGGVPVCGPKKGLYRWKVANRKLTLTKLKDTCAAEVGLFTGVWKRG